MLVNIVIFTADEKNDDPKLDAGRYKRGDVICVEPIEHEFIKSELSHPKWRVATSDLQKTLIEALIAGDTTIVEQKTVPRRRKYNLDLSQLNPEYFKYPYKTEKAEIPAQEIIAAATQKG